MVGTYFLQLIPIKMSAHNSCQCRLIVVIITAQFVTPLTQGAKYLYCTSGGFFLSAYNFSKPFRVNYIYYQLKKSIFTLGIDSYSILLVTFIFVFQYSVIIYLGGFFYCQALGNIISSGTVQAMFSVVFQEVFPSLFIKPICPHNPPFPILFTRSTHFSQTFYTAHSRCCNRGSGFSSCVTTL